MARDEELSTADIAGTRDHSGDAADEPVARERAETETELDTGTDAVDEQAPLIGEDDGGDLRRRWDEIQTGFVDEPRKAVQDADALVAEAMQQLAETFARERTNLESQWDRGDDVSTEDLRVALRRYRAFFDRLLTV